MSNVATVFRIACRSIRSYESEIVPGNTLIALIYFERRESSEIFTNKQTGGNGNALFVVRSRAGISMIRAFNETSIPGIAPEVRDC